MMRVGAEGELMDVQANSIGCLDDFDCNENELCYRNTTWFQTNILPFVALNISAAESSRLGCACNTWYAWKGLNCDEISTETRFFGTWAIVLTLNALMCLLAISVSMCIYLTLFVAYRDYEGRLGCKFRWNCRCNAFVRIMLSFWLTSFGMLTWSLGIAASSFDVSGSFLAEDWYLDGDPYNGRQNVYGFFGGLLATVFITLGSILTAVEWIRVSRNLRKYNFIRGNDNSIRRLKYFFALFMLLAFSAVAGGLVYERSRTDSGSNIQGFTLTLFGFCLVFLFFYSAVTFTRIITDISTKTREIAEKYKTTTTRDKEIPPSPRVHYEIDEETEWDFAGLFVVPETAKRSLHNETLFSSQNVTDFEKDAWELYGPEKGNSSNPQNSSSGLSPIRIILRNGAPIRLHNPILSSSSEDKDIGEDGRNNAELIESQIEMNKKGGEKTMGIPANSSIKGNPSPEHIAIESQRTKKFQSQGGATANSSGSANRSRTIGDRLLSVVPSPRRMGSDFSSRIKDVLKLISVPPEVEPAFKKIILSVRDTAFLGSISTLGYVLALLSFSIIDTKGHLAFQGIGWRDNGNPGNPFSGIKFAYYFQVTFSSLILVAFTRYIYIVCRNPSKVTI